MTDTRIRAARFTRVIAAAIWAAPVAGIVGGLLSRLAMWLVKVGNDSYNGQVTHEGYEVGRLTLQGLVNLAVQGLFYAIPLGFVYAVVRWWLPGRGWQKGLWFGAWLLLWTAPAVVDVGNHEHYRYASPLRSFVLFAALIPLTSVVLAAVAERWGRGDPSLPTNRVVRWGGWCVLAGVAVVGARSELAALRSVSHAW